MGFPCEAVRTVFDEPTARSCLTSTLTTRLLGKVPYKDTKVPPDHLLLDIGLLILDHSYLVGNLTKSKIAETKALEPLKS